MTFRFIGSEATIEGHKVTKFGEAIELSDGSGVAAIRGNSPIVPDSEFQACGFTAEELSEYAYPGPRGECSAEFGRKWFAARLALHEIRERLKAGGPLVVAGGE